MKSFISVTIQMKAVEQYFPVVKFGFLKEFAPNTTMFLRSL